jgi:hypothetical protein
MLMDLTQAVHSTARALEGLRANRLRLVRSVAIVIGILLSIASADRLEAQNLPTKSLKSLASYQLTDKQYKCHNEIIYRESRWNIDAVNGSHYGYYQMKNKHIKGKPYDFQFYMYWYYVSHRYGFDKQYPEIPDYCKALKHLKTRGWQ